MNYGKALVITASIGRKTLRQAVQSVIAQTYQDYEHLIVVDGAKNWDKAMDVLEGLPLDKIRFMLLPWACGGVGGYCYSTGSLINRHSYVLYLDDDNWYEPDHIESLIRPIRLGNSHWSYTLRKIWSKERDVLVCEDVPESLHVDTSAYCFTGKLARTLGPGWLSNLPYNDRAIRKLLEQFKMIGVWNQKWTLNYRCSDSKITYPAGGKNE